MEGMNRYLAHLTQVTYIGHPALDVLLYRLLQPTGLVPQSGIGGRDDMPNDELD